MKSIGNGTVQKLSETPPCIVDLPSSLSTPAKIILTGEMTATVNVYVTSEIYCTWAKSDAIAATRITSNTTRRKFPAGIHEFECSGNHEDNLYLVSTGSAVTEGISYSYNDFA